ncbi:hypothetical protein H0H93_015252 [Arthromyces matolae]|nr:hypothetical protein H0H93_015252 [Arthromyces matolae]
MISGSSVCGSRSLKVLVIHQHYLQGRMQVNLKSNVPSTYPRPRASARRLISNHLQFIERSLRPLEPPPKFPFAPSRPFSHKMAASAGGFKITDAPNPSWTYGQKVGATPQGREWLEGEKDGWKTVDTSSEDPIKLYGLLTTGIVPRPVAFVSTVSEDGTTNIAPYSWFNQVSSNPPVLSVSVNTLRNPVREKDTAKNIKATKCFTVNIISEPWVAQSNVTSVDAPENFSEWPISGLTMEPSLLQAVDVPIPATGELGTTVFLGSIKFIHVRKDILDDRGNIDPGKLKPVARMGGTLYAKCNEGYHISRPSWKADETAIREATDLDV